MKRAIKRVRLGDRQGIDGDRHSSRRLGARRRGSGLNNRIDGDNLRGRLFGPWKYLHDAHG
jgi:hypothetical protein